MYIDTCISLYIYLSIYLYLSLYIYIYIYIYRYAAGFSKVHVLNFLPDPGASNSRMRTSPESE